MVAVVFVGGSVCGEGGEMKIRVKFPMIKNPEGDPTAARRNHKVVREALLLDTENSGVEKALVSAAEQAAGPGQEVFVSRGYTAKGRLAVWIVDQSGKGSVRERKKALRDALARVQV